MTTLLLALFLAQAPPPAKAAQIQQHTRQAQQLLQLNRPAEAIAELQAVLALDPSNLEALSNLGVLRFFAGQYEAALAPLRRALKLKPALSNIQAMLGMAERRTGAAALARADLEKAFPLLQAEKIKLQAGLELIEIYFASNEMDKAATVVAALRLLRPTDPEILYTARRIYAAQADEVMLALSMTAPQGARMHQVMAQEMARQGDIAGSIRHYREAARIDPAIPGLHFELAERLAEAADAAESAQAEAEYAAALKENPFDLRAACRLSEIRLKQGDLAPALDYGRLAARLGPNDAEALFVLAKALLANDKSAEALPLLERAAKLDPFNATIHYRLGGAYRQLDRPEDARRELTEYQRLREMKDQLRQVYIGMRLQPSKSDRLDAEAKP